MPVTEAGVIPEGARDITEDVVRIKDALNDLFEGEDMGIIGTAIGAVIGENLTDMDAVKQLLYLIVGVASEHFILNNPDVQTPEGARVH